MPFPTSSQLHRLHTPLPPRAWALAVLLIGGLALWPALGQTQTRPEADAAGLQQLAREFVTPAVDTALQPATTDAPLRPEVLVGTLDTRLRLARCNQVEPHLPPGTRLWGRSRMGLRCVDGPTRWNVFIPVTVKAWGPAWVLRRPVASGALLTQEDAEMAEVDWAAQPSRVLAQPAQWVGRQAAMALQPGQALRDHMVRSAQAFAAGALVKVSGSGTGFAVAVTGEAMAPGVLGQTTRVRLPGGKVVTGVVRDAQTVELSL